MRVRRHAWLAAARGGSAGTLARRARVRLARKRERVRSFGRALAKLAVLTRRLREFEPSCFLVAHAARVATRHSLKRCLTKNTRSNVVILNLAVLLSSVGRIGMCASGSSCVVCWRRTGPILTDEAFGGCTKLLCLGAPNRPPIAIQSRSHRFQSQSNVRHCCCFCSLFVVKRWPSSLHTWKLEGTDIARMGRASLVKFAQSPPNRRPTAVQSRNSAAKLWFAASSLCQQADLNSTACAGEINTQLSRRNFCASPCCRVCRQDNLKTMQRLNSQ